MNKISIIIRTLNEAKYLQELLDGIKQQELRDFPVETIVVDSGSDDGTIDIATNNNCKLIHIKKSEFSFGRSLNVGCQNASGDIYVIISGHCIPVDKYWLKNLVTPILTRQANYVYGRQIGRDTTMFSEGLVFKKYFPEDEKYDYPGYFCNNANSAIEKIVWSKYKFDEDITGLEDLELGKRLYENGGKIAYANNARVYHIHNENWTKIKTRYERETLAFLNFEPSMQLRFFQLINGFLLSVTNDLSHDGIKIGNLLQIGSIIQYRSAQYFGYWVGNKKMSQVSAKTKSRFYYP
jgi:glycosyltransferase involved in cell wall biosynthesis